MKLSVPAFLPATASIRRVSTRQSEAKPRHSEGKRWLLLTYFETSGAGVGRAVDSSFFQQQQQQQFESVEKSETSGGGGGGGERWDSWAVAQDGEERSLLRCSIGRELRMKGAGREEVASVIEDEESDNNARVDL